MKNIVYFILSQWLEFSAWSSLQYAQYHESSILIFKDTVHRAGSGWRYRSVFDMSSLKHETRGFLPNSVCCPFCGGPLKFVRATLFLKCQFGTPKNCQQRTQLRLRLCYIRVVFFINRKRRNEVSAPLELAARVSGEPQGPLLLLHTTPLTVAQWIFSALLEIRLGS